MSDPIFGRMPIEAAIETEGLARVLYEARVHRTNVLEAFNASNAEELLDRITRGEVAEHPAYEHYLAARILTETHDAARSALAAKLAEVNRA